MDLVDLNKRSVRLGIPKAIVEKDYVLSVALLAISNSILRNRLVFKGGTAFKKAWFSQSRFSEDLDFTVLSGVEEDVQKELERLLENKEISGVRFGTLKREKTRAGLRAAIKYSSFLEHAQRIRFDFSFRENLASKPVEKALFDDYGIGVASMRVLSLEEILAEKIHALSCRVVARDLYDLWFLRKNGVGTSESIVERKFSYYHERYEPAMLAMRLEFFRPKWKMELELFLPKVPDFDELGAEAMEMLKTAVEKG